AARLSASAGGRPARAWAFLRAAPRFWPASRPVAAARSVPARHPRLYPPVWAARSSRYRVPTPVHAVKPAGAEGAAAALAGLWAQAAVAAATSPVSPESPAGAEARPET